MPYTFSQCLDAGCETTVGDLQDAVTPPTPSSSGSGYFLPAGTVVYVQRSPDPTAELVPYALSDNVNLSFLAGSAYLGPDGRTTRYVQATLGASVSATRVVSSSSGPTPPSDILLAGQTVTLVPSTPVGRVAPPEEGPPVSALSEAERAVRGSFPDLPTSDISFEGMTAAYPGYLWGVHRSRWLGLSVDEIPYKSGYITGGRFGRGIRVTGPGEYAFRPSNPAAFGGFDRIVVPVITRAFFSGRVRDTPLGTAPIARFADGSFLFVPIRTRAGGRRSG